MDTESDELVDRPTGPDDVLANPLQASLAFDPTTPVDRKKRHELTVRVGVPKSAVFVFPDASAAGQSAGSLRIWLAAVDRETGARTGVRQETFALQSAGNVDDAGSYEIAVRMDLPEGNYWVAVGVRDETTGTTSILRKSVEVPLAVTEPSPTATAPADVAVH